MFCSLSLNIYNHQWRLTDPVFELFSPEKCFNTWWMLGNKKDDKWFLSRCVISRFAISNLLNRLTCFLDHEWIAIFSFFKKYKRKRLCRLVLHQTQSMLTFSPQVFPKYLLSGKCWFQKDNLSKIFSSPPHISTTCNANRSALIFLLGPIFFFFALALWCSGATLV